MQLNRSLLIKSYETSPLFDTHMTYSIYIYIHMHRIFLIGGLEHFFIFPYLGHVIIPTDELIFSRVVGIPPTRYPSNNLGYRELDNNVYIYIYI